MTKQSQKTHSSSGARLKYIRGLVKVTRTYIHEKYGLPQFTLKSWENVTTKLTVTGADRCVEVYREEGLTLTLNRFLLVKV